MTTIIKGVSGGDPLEIMLTCLSDKELRDVGVSPSEHQTALLTVRSKDSDLGISQLEQLGRACLHAAKMLKQRKGKR
jgi:hypothetical protein